jgi:predicted thioesterase
MLHEMIQIGIKGHEEAVVTEDMLASNVGSGLVKVYSTAMMIALIEKAAVLSVEPYLEQGQGSVGTLVNVSHCSATPLGMKVHAETELVEVDRRRLVFKVAAYDERGLIGEGMHERFIIDNARFQAKADSK